MNGARQQRVHPVATKTRSQQATIRQAMELLPMPDMVAGDSTPAGDGDFNHRAMIAYSILLPGPADSSQDFGQGHDQQPALATGVGSGWIVLGTARRCPVPSTSGTLSQLNARRPAGADRAST